MPLFASLLPAYGWVWLRTGRICGTVEGAGKRRIFAIGNYLKQRLLRPVHDWAMQVLSRIPNDGTFDQEAPIHRLRWLRPMELFSFDLKSATDRWPLSVMHDLMACLFGPTLASSIVNGTLGLNTFHVCPPLLWCDEHNTGDILPGWSSTGILRLLDTVRAVSPFYG